MTAPNLAIVDYGLGNLFSVARAAEWAGFRPVLAATSEALLAADAVLLPGVGAFGDAMANLARDGLDTAILEAAKTGKPVIGVCLGLQLLFEESHEFGSHKGLGLLAGSVERLPGEEGLKIPSVGWVPVEQARDWSGTPLAGLASGAYQYFVHSYVVRPTEQGVCLSETPFGSHRFCSAVEKGNIFACQFHPERSGWAGLGIYAGLKNWVTAGQG
ncbi:MAG: imidazole glycerol phosphate synthase subunit HisH [Rhodospirillales bacterium]